MVDGVFGPGVFADLGEGRSLRFDEGPVFLPFGAVFDPGAQDFFFPGGELSSGFRRWHDVVGIITEDAEDDFAGVRVSGDDGGDAVAGGFGLGFKVEAESGFAGGGVGAVAVKAGVREDGEDVAVKGDLGSAERGGEDEKEEIGKKTEHRGWVRSTGESRGYFLVGSKW